jgi:5'-3' exoribonuclease 1
MGVLPSLSSALVPAPLAELMTNLESPIASFYPLHFESDLNGKKNSWEAVVKIPFIDENSLLDAVQRKIPLLSEEERRRNAFGPAVTFEFTPKSTCVLPGPSATFPALESCHVLEHVISISDPPRDLLRRGLTPGVEFGFQGPATFPSLAALPAEVQVSGSLQHLDVAVFPGALPSKSLTLGLVLMMSDESAALEGNTSLGCPALPCPGLERIFSFLLKNVSFPFRRVQM